MSAINRWPNMQWRNFSEKPIDNVELWKDLVGWIKKVKAGVYFRKVKAHSKSVHNKEADRLAKISAKKPFNKPISQVSVRRKITKESVDSGSVKMGGQRIIIRIITSKYLTKNESKYKYEVVSRRSKYHGKVDWIYGPHEMRGAHCYVVKVNNDMDYPQVKEIIRELFRKEK